MERIFCQHYIQNGFNARQAARTAGYTDVKAAAWAVKRRPHVQAFLNEHKAKMDKKLDYSLDKVLALITECLESCYKDTADGGKKVADRGSFLKAIAEINKIKGYYPPVKQVNLNANADVEKDADRELVMQYVGEFRSPV